MKEPQLKQINKQQSNINPINTQQKEPNKQKTEKQVVINSLPSWNIEPPLEIKRGN